MPRPGKGWRHVTISTLNAWLPGDARGWRSRGHKKHSSGDYNTPPPEGEHQGLHQYAQRVSGDTIVIPIHLRATVGEALREFLQAEHEVLAIAVGGTHAHLLIELPLNGPAARRIIGHAKNLASRRIRSELPGRVWAAGGGFKPVKDADHQQRVFQYIRNHVDEGAWVWTFRDGVVKED